MLCPQRRGPVCSHHLVPGWGRSPFLLPIVVARGVWREMAAAGCEAALRSGAVDGRARQSKDRRGLFSREMKMPDGDVKLIDAKFQDDWLHQLPTDIGVPRPFFASSRNGTEWIGSEAKRRAADFGASCFPRKAASNNNVAALSFCLIEALS